MIQKSEQFSKSHVLDQMHKLLSKEKGWTQNALARDNDGAGVVPESKYAVSFDIIGALYHIEYKNPTPSNIRVGREVREVLGKALNVINADGLKNINDVVSKDNFTYHMNKYNDATGRTQMEILRLVEKAKEY